MEFLVVAIVLAVFFFYAASVVFMVLAIAASWVCMTLGSILRPILAPIIRVLDTKLW